MAAKESGLLTIWVPVPDFPRSPTAWKNVLLESCGGGWTTLLPESETSVPPSVTLMTSKLLALRAETVRRCVRALLLWRAVAMRRVNAVCEAARRGKVRVDFLKAQSEPAIPSRVQNNRHTDG